MIRMDMETRSEPENMSRLNRRRFLGCVSAVAIAFRFGTHCEAFPRGATDAFYPAFPATPVETPESGRVDDVALISQQMVGPKLTDLFPGFASPASTVVQKSGTNFLRRSDGADKLLLTSTYDCRDSEVTTWFSKGIVFLRLTGGRAIYFGINLHGATQLDVGIAENFDETGDPVNSGQRYLSFAFDLSTVSGWSSSYTAVDLYTFGASGVDVYVKYKGVEILRYKEWRHVAAGHFAIWQQGNGIPDTTVKYVPATLQGTNRAQKYFDIRDFGAKTSQTMGSISASSMSLTVASVSGFAVNDYIIVEIGGEAGAGARGTSGVGGTWPTQSYPNTTAMNADTSKPERTYAWDTSSGLVYIYASGSWIYHSDGSGPYNQAYYTEKALPKALRAKITAIVGNVITLNTAATTTTSNANVYVDCVNSFNVLTDDFSDNYSTPSGMTIGVPAGSFAVGAAVYGSNRPGLTIGGRGKRISTLFSPKGTTCISLGVQSSDNSTIRDLSLLGNHGTGSSPDGFQFLFASGSNDHFIGWPITCGFILSSNCTHRNISVQDVLSYGIYQSRCIDTWAYNCDLTMTASLKQYTQWFFQVADAMRGGMVDCDASGPKLMKCFETFNGDLVQFIRCGGQNVLAAANSSGGYLFEEFYSTINMDSYDNIGAGFFHEPVININAHAYPNAKALLKGGTIKNARIIQTGFAEPTNKETMIAILIQRPCVNMTVSGEYSKRSLPFSSELGGYFQSPDYAVVNAGKLFASAGAIAVRSEAVNTTVKGIRTVGAPKRGHGGIEFGLTATGSASSIALLMRWLWRPIR